MVTVNILNTNGKDVRFSASFGIWTQSIDRDALTKELQKNGLSEDEVISLRMEADEINIVYTMHDRFIVGGAMPVNNKALQLETFEYLKAPNFLSRREIGIINVGGTGTVTVKEGSKEKTYELKYKEALYVGSGKHEVYFASNDPSQPAHFYFNSATAHTSYPARKITLEDLRKKGCYIEAGSMEESNDRVDVYYVKIQSYRRGNYVYGVLTVPKTPGRKPAILRLPGAAVRSYHGPHELAYEGFVVLEIGVHGIPVDQSPEVYQQLEEGALSSYTTIGIDNRDTYYYKRSILGCVRAVDYLCTRDDVDTTRIATYGGSQGGMLSIMTAALSPRVSALFSYFPAFCDLTGYYHGRGAGWPHLFRDRNEPNLQARIEVSRYYDTVNFARLLRVPGFYAWGFNDPACCPTSTFSAYNVITAPKQLQVGRDTGHWLYPWQVDNALRWLKQQFGME